ncbi:MAG: exo-alpha-sialidase, partial [Candidatus Eremiobacteraeota bacterium]|nr:exo-alpha-sialidase [Candidatus Eremiobacteraeota bacterium]
VNEDPIVVNVKNTKQLLTGGNDYNCAALRGHYLSPDGGKTWNRSCDPLPSGGSGLGDPIVGFDTKNTAWAGGINSTSSGYVIDVQSSTDQGKTWSAPIAAVTALFSGGLTDKPWMQIDTNSGSKFKNNIYISITQFDSSNGTQITVSNSKNGTKWSAPIPVSSHATYPNINQFSDIGIAKNGTLYVTWLNCTANGSKGDCGGTKATIMLSTSTDGGKTWSTPSVIDNVTLAPDTAGCCFYGQLPNTSERVSDIPAIGVDTSSKSTSGNLYVIEYTWTGTQMVVRVITSTNGGKTWSKPVNVAGKNPKNDEFFPWINVSSAGTVGASWLDRRNDPANVNYEAFGAYSSNAKKFSKNLDLSAKPSNPNNDGFGSGFMGDYTGNFWAGSKALYVSWMDTTFTNTDCQDAVGGFQK